MRVQIVTYNLNGISEGDYLDVANQLAARFSALPGLLAKIWLEDPESNTYGGIYLWDDEESMQRFLRSDLFEGTNPEFSNVTSQDFNVFENLTRQTQPVLEVLEEPARAYAPPPLPPQEAPAAPAAPPAPATKIGAKKIGAKKIGAKKAVAIKGLAKKAPKKALVKKALVKKAVAKKVQAKKAVAIKGLAKKVPVKKAPAKKASARKGTAKLTGRGTSRLR
jgi:heme-degrading monooxygenase HmoA